jgi:hypothetical protein
LPLPTPQTFDSRRLGSHNHIGVNDNVNTHKDCEILRLDPLW